ncbi:LytR C-terminal domain-containing protein [Bifidobacterium thermacidophilum]|uniref:LytR cell envelope-related transcriptional attenuator n=1 Tax=Bifidobacterium thermacidophilum subsp. thermacidophilum TaxID=79262 RepID=A0A087E170_9BIFI|nr:LytR C-terminal domain-containing protein [Bifidobacterium thermacidophilum]KFJ01521.1 LytR cell envelope-related transcriptional attenuator [Bifidobacterium thermacidophilum subsp. thermacidophilum]
MARKDRNTDESYAQDVFDNPPQGPIGVHRGNRSVASRLVPFLIVIIVAAVAGVGAWAAMSGEGAKLFSSSSSASSSSSPSAKSTASASASASASDTASASASASESASESASPSESTSSPASSSSANLSTQVRVVNGTRKTGYAAKQAAVLTGAGYTNVVAANPSGTLPSASVVWYQNESDLATAQDVAAKLGISNVSKVTNLSAPVVVVLMN